MMDELSRILVTFHGGLSTRKEALESLRKLDPILRFYRPAEYWLSAVSNEEDDEALVRKLLVKYGYNPNLEPRGVSGPPGEFNGIDIKDGKPVPCMLRNWVCELDGTIIDGHEGSDLDPGSTECIQCGKDWADPNI